MGKLTELAKKFVKTSDDRRTNMIYVEGAEVDGGGLISLGRHQHIIDAKAEYADLLWIVEKILEEGQKVPQ
jgi:hypothetical protein